MRDSSDLLNQKEFCSLYHIGKKTYYQLLTAGLPRLSIPGMGIRISHTEAQAWFLLQKEEKKIKIDLAPANRVINNKGEKAKTMFSLSYNKKRAVWIAQYKTKEGTWKTKYLPTSILQHQETEASNYITNWLPLYLETGTTKHSVAKKTTIAFLSDRWLKYREEDQKTSPNTLKGFKQNINTWILNNPKFPHISIQDLDITTELTVSTLLRWIDSLKQSPSSKLSQISTLRSMLQDCISLGWIDSETINPLSKPAITTLERTFKCQKEEARVNCYLTSEQVKTLLTFNHSSMTDYKRMRYLLAITTGLRDMEIQALQWKDIDFSLKTIRVNKQLLTRGSLPLTNYFEARQNPPAKNVAISKDPKGNSKRILPLHSLTLQALSYWKKVGWKNHTNLTPTEESPVFPRSSISLKNKTGEKAGDFCITVAAEGLQDDLRRANLPLTFTDAMGGTGPITFHSLRHTFSHLLDTVGAGAELIGVLLGHSAKSVGRAVYIPANIEKWREIVDLLPVEEVVFEHRSIGKGPKLKLVKGEKAG